MSEQESPKTARKSPVRAESPSPELIARRKQMLTVYVGRSAFPCGPAPSCVANRFRSLPPSLRPTRI